MELQPAYYMEPGEAQKVKRAPICITRGCPWIEVKFDQLLGMSETDVIWSGSSCKPKPLRLVSIPNIR